MIGLPDTWAEHHRFLRDIHPGTWQKQSALYEWIEGHARNAALGEQDRMFSESQDAVVRRGWELREQLFGEFRDKLSSRSAELRILIFTPSYKATAAGYSLAHNLAKGLSFLGIPSRCWHQGEPLAPLLQNFTPTLLLANDPEKYERDRYLENFDWDAVRDYRWSHKLQIGLVAGPYSKDPVVWERRLTHVRRLGIDFFYSFQAPEFIERHHSIYRKYGFPVYTLEFGANPLVYYPVDRVERDVEYVFLGSAHFEKWERYNRFFRDVMREHPGFICGADWSGAAHDRIDEQMHRYIYARAKVALNLHVPFQIDDATELNERAYNLAACGVPQLTDAPKLLPQRFRSGSMYVGATPKEYREQFARILRNPEEARQRALGALEDVYAGHTIFHRAEAFIDQITSTN